MNWQYTRLPDMLQFGPALVGGIFAWVDYNRSKRNGAVLAAVLWTIAFLLPMFSGTIMRSLPASAMSLIDLLIPNNRNGLVFYLVLTLAPFLYYGARIVAWFNTPSKPARKKK